MNTTKTQHVAHSKTMLKTVTELVSHCIFNIGEICGQQSEPQHNGSDEQEHQLGRVMPARHGLHNTPEEEDHPSESRPYKQYCTTLLTLVKAEAILIGSCLQGNVDE